MSVAGEQEFSTEIAASPLECFKTVMDFERYPEWSSAIQRATVLERDKDGFGRLIEYRIDMKFKSIRYVLHYTYRKPTELTWRSTEGDVESIQGAYTFEKLDAKRTRATCRQAIALGFWVPGPVRKLLERTALQQSVLEFKTAVENRAAAKGNARGKR
jgi:ribosome-associated toxin RatA of RatAB toxin-antitoxin module